MSGGFDRPGREYAADAGHAAVPSRGAVAPGKVTLTGRMSFRSSPSIARGALRTGAACVARLRDLLPALEAAVDPAGARDIEQARAVCGEVDRHLAGLASAVTTARDHATTPELAAEVAARAAELAELEATAEPLLARRPPSYSSFDDVMASLLTFDTDARARLDAADARARTDWTATLDAAGAARAPSDPAVGLAATPGTDLGADRGALESAFGVSLDDVQLHGGEAATGMVDQLGAQAFAVGNNVALPQRLGADRAFVLAHEIAHVVQQRGGTGGLAGDPEEAAEAAAHAFVAGRPVPAQPAAAVGVACRGTVARPQTRTPVEGRDPNAYGDGQPIGTTPIIGNQNGHDAGSGTDWNAAAAEAALRGDLDAVKRELEQPKPTVEYGGAAPHFITAGNEKQQTFSGKSKGHQRNLTVYYKPHRFHALSSILYDVLRARTLDEIASIWSAYLADKPKAPPWRLHEPEPRPWEMQTCRVEGPNWWEPTRLVLPAGSPMAPDAQVFVKIGDYFVSWPYRLTPFPEDSDGQARYGTLVTVIETIAETEVIPELSKRVGKRRKKDAIPTTQPAAGADPAATPSNKDPAHDAQNRKRPIPTLILPLGKEPHLGLYQSLASERRLVNEAGYKRGNPKQADKWDAVMKHGGSQGIPASVWKEAKKLLKQLGRDYEEAHRPQWARFQINARMEVDHIVELQVVTRGDRGWADSIVNYELLERGANRSSGSLMDDHIDKERKRLFDETGDRKYLDDNLAFEKVVLGSTGITGERWTPMEIRDGEHIDALRANVAVEAFDAALTDGALNFW